MRRLRDTNAVNMSIENLVRRQCVTRVTETRSFRKLSKVMCPIVDNVGGSKFGIEAAPVNGTGFIFDTRKRRVPRTVNRKRRARHVIGRVVLKTRPITVRFNYVSPRPDFFF